MSENAGQFRPGDERTVENGRKGGLVGGPRSAAAQGNYGRGNWRDREVPVLSEEASPGPITSRETYEAWAANLPHWVVTGQLDRQTADAITRGLREWREGLGMGELARRVEALEKGQP